ncbi:sterol desaturase family protein [Fluviicola chungangensis]|uniref:Sterol desaturase family protein n=1 Tax=Fluviicola chungangensis TaxID=2597671 RepID=A0A556N733_9FLAO|nr:sterol desaturase family protein [Fluviicola chungangensis]TSJ47965.1 sterol desaturase family protein [Fluviicola chungangensis]
MEVIPGALERAGLFGVIGYGLVINFAIYIGSLGVYSMLSVFPGNQRLGNRQPVILQDILLSIVTVFCNTLVFVLGVYLWKYGFIRLDKEYGFLQVAVELVSLTLIMDLLMYVFHRAVHFLSHMKQIHERHHEHQSTNLLSLFVLHPIESIGFGGMMLGVLIFYPFSAMGISLYLLLNSLWGTIGHLNHSILPPSWIKLAKKGFLCTSEFHYLHHRDPNYNFGFYTSVWDLLFKTIHPAYRNAATKTTI